MVVLSDSIIINAAPEEIFNTIIEIFSNEKNYKMWHEDHVTCKWLKGIPFEKGSVLYAEEYLHGQLHKMKFLSTTFIKNTKYEYKLLFPVSIICPKGSFLIESENENYIFTASLSFRFSGFVNRFFKNRINAIKKHMNEEGKNLKKIVEQ